LTHFLHTEVFLLDTPRIWLFLQDSSQGELRILIPTTKKKKAILTSATKIFLLASSNKQNSSHPQNPPQIPSLSHPEESISFLKKRDFWMPRVVRKKYS